AAIEGNPNSFGGATPRFSRARRTRAAACVIATAMCGMLASGAGAAGSETPSATVAPTLAQLVGQRMLVAIHGTTADSTILARIRAGQVGGVILFSSNISDATQLAHLTAQLQAAAKAGGRPRLLIATDQEGGLVRRLPW